MIERTDTSKPEQIVRLRRDKDGPVQQLKRTALILAIKRGKLLRTDEYSVDGISWSQLDHHPQLKKIFDGLESAVQSPLEDSTAKGEREHEAVEEEGQSNLEQTTETESVHPMKRQISCPLCMQANFNDQNFCCSCGCVLSKDAAVIIADIMGSDRKMTLRRTKGGPIREMTRGELIPEIIMGKALQSDEERLYGNTWAPLWRDPQLKKFFDEIESAERKVEVSNSGQRAISPSDTKVCPFCAETIKAAAIKCRFCGSDFANDSPRKLAATYYAPKPVSSASSSIQAVTKSSAYSSGSQKVNYPVIEGMSSTKFLVLFLIPMVLTYSWRLAGISTVLEDSSYDNSSIESVSLSIHFLLIISYAVMAYVAYRRGKAIGKTYLAAFPIVAGVFDIFLGFVLYIPSVMNIITIVMAMPDSKPIMTQS